MGYHALNLAIHHTLAASYAEIGRFDEARSVASSALALAPAREPAIVPELEHRLALYAAGRPFRQASAEERAP